MQARKHRLLIVMAIILLGLSGLNLWLEPSEADADEPWSDAWPGLRAAAVDGITLSGQNTDVVLQRTQGGWTLGGSAAKVADTRRTDQLLESVTRLSIGPPLDADALSGFGLATPRRRVVLTADGEVLAEVAVGRNAPAGSGTYVQIADELHMTRFPLGEGIDGGPEHYITREFVRFPQSAVTEIRITGTLPHTHLVREDASWTVGVTKTPAVAGRVNAFLGAIADLRVEAFGASAGIPEDERIVTLHTPDATLELQIWRQGSRWWGIGPLHKGPVELTSGLAPMLGLPLDTWSEPIPATGR